MAATILNEDLGDWLTVAYIITSIVSTSPRSQRIPIARLSAC